MNNIMRAEYHPRDYTVRLYFEGEGGDKRLYLTVFTLMSGLSFTQPIQHLFYESDIEELREILGVAQRVIEASRAGRQET